jgi:hypothetical protein
MQLKMKIQGPDRLAWLAGWEARASQPANPSSRAPWSGPIVARHHRLVSLRIVGPDILIAAHCWIFFLDFTHCTSYLPTLI